MLTSPSGRPSSAAVRRETYACEVPWKPYRRMPCSAATSASIAYVAAAGGQRAVERGVEDRDLRHVRQQLPGHRDAGQVGRVVQRRQRDQPLDRGDHLVVDQRRRG